MGSHSGDEGVGMRGRRSDQDRFQPAKKVRPHTLEYTSEVQWFSNGGEVYSLQRIGVSRLGNNNDLCKCVPCHAVRQAQEILADDVSETDEIGVTSLRLKEVRITEFRRFTDLTIRDIPETTRLILLAGPNGCGKSSFFDALYTWYSWNAGKGYRWEKDYHVKAGSTERDEPGDDIELSFHDDIDVSSKKNIYARSAYRNDPEFNLNRLSMQGDLLDQISVHRMIDNDVSVSRNYQRLVSQSVAAVHGSGIGEETSEQYRRNTTLYDYDRDTIGRVAGPLSKLFPDLILDSLGNPLENGTFYFTKGTSEEFVFKNLSGGEKAAFDLILDLIVAKKEYDNTIYCIDEPEAHMHTKLQANLLSVLYDLIPNNCQLILATHSIGIMRMARELENENPGTVVFLDFGDVDFDEPATLEPVRPNRNFWKRAYDVALGDIAELVAPSQVVICEGEPATTPPPRNHSIDAQCYSNIFEEEFPDTEFISMGSDSQILGDKRGLAEALQKLLGAVSITRLVDRDDRSDEEVSEARVSSNVRVLSRRNLESYLFDDEVLKALAIANEKGTLIPQLLSAKQTLLAEITDRAADDLKPASGRIYNDCKTILRLTRPGNNATAFMRDTLSKHVRPDMTVYSELKQDIFEGES